MIQEFLGLRPALRDEGAGPAAGGGAPPTPEPAAEPRAPKAPRRPRLGLALGGGAARGWAHIGVIRALEKAGLKPDVIVGTSIGAVVGGCYAAGKLDPLEAFARSLTKSRVLWLLDFHIGSGLISGDRLRKLLDRDVGDVAIEDLGMRYAAVATELHTGHEIWLTRGSLVRAMQASYALPGVFDPVHLGGRWLFDGALVNPIPVTTTRALSAELVIAVNLNADLFGRGAVIPDHGDAPEQEEMAETIAEGLFSPMLGAARSLTQRLSRGGPTGPGLATVMVDAFNITQDRIARARMAGDPPDVHLKPRLGKIGLFDFHRAEESIRLGEESFSQAAEDLALAMEALTVPA
ncbi:patatin-like phospholipase family protein [Alsobacter sp. SYSU M60028]|uniref:Patatin-like phospholipase family protein n=1 Tax=Alsobacter ponti TaxID=2962936 RepID=A0ABT1LFS8_9HYPH|nr:patatin-like phospholipase family protein [Alsobacter ponti]MCP8940347.1 patatin-like phospholipase family protein [Alsobacter ponti]